MFFNSLEFLVFLPIVVVLYYLLPQRFRWFWLLVCSYYFYMSWKPIFALLIIGSTLIDFFVAKFIYQTQNKGLKKFWLSLSLCTNLGLLAVFKYYNFYSAELAQLLGDEYVRNWLPVLTIALPVGISFYTFQTLSYTLDVYYGRQKPEEHLGIFSLYVSFFPQLVAGPIERFSHLGTQLKEKHLLQYSNFSNGFRLIIFGLFIKMAVADNLSPYVDTVYQDFENLNSWSIATGIFFYSFQIYADFFGYSTIAIGAARLLGIDIMDNFKSPYFSRSITEFWKRWHISLTTWFREYLYLPLGGNRVANLRWIINILIVFIVSGFWHGANWTFIIWGAIHGVIYLVESYSTKFSKRKAEYFANWLQILLRIKTFFIVCIAWVFFRAQSFDEAKLLLKHLFTNLQMTDNFSVEPIVWFILLFFVIADYLLRKERIDIWLAQKPTAFRWFSYAVLIFGLMALGGVTHHPFIYFQF